MPDCKTFTWEATLQILWRNYRSLCVSRRICSMPARRSSRRRQRSVIVNWRLRATLCRDRSASVCLIEQPLIDLHDGWHVGQRFAERWHMPAVAFHCLLACVISRERELEIAVVAHQ